MDTAIDDAVTLPDAPGIPGLIFRRFRGESDYPKMVEVLQASKTVDRMDDVDTVDTITRDYANLKNSDPYRDMLFVEIDGRVVGYSRVEWWEETDGTRIYGNFGFVVPEWRGKGIGRAMLHHSESRLREIASEHPDCPRFFDTWAYDHQPALIELLASEGYAVVRHFYDMVRPDLENIPDLPLPDGLEVRPVRLEDYRAIWEAEAEAFLDHWGATPPEESDFERWRNGTEFQPELWQVAWDGDQVAGMVRNFIDKDQNAGHNRLRGYTENISVRRPWRKRGLARALIARSFHVLKEQGMTEAALGVDTDNPSGALKLYENMGFHVVKSSGSYRKPME